MGLEKLLRGLYGSVPQIDMDKQIARSRVPQPMTLDFARLADGIKRNNVGVAAITLEAVCIVKDGRVMIQPTGQSFSLSGTPPVESGPVRRSLKLLDWEDPSKCRLEAQ
jgi:hypothetical protein